MRVLAPEASDPEPIFRKIPPPKSKKPGVDDDSPAKDLASPGGNAGHDDTGSAGDPGGRSIPAPSRIPVHPSIRRSHPSPSFPQLQIRVTPRATSVMALPMTRAITAKMRAP